MSWLSGWSYRRAITITEQSGSTLTDYQVRIELNSSNFDFSKANSDGSDIQFTADDGETLLSYWIEKWDDINEEAIIWIKVPSIPANGSITIYMYYGNEQAQSESDANAVFDLFDDFEDNDISDWIVDYGSFSVSDGIVTTATDTSSLMHKEISISEGAILEHIAKPIEGGAAPAIVFAMQDENNFYMSRVQEYQNAIELYKNDEGTFTKLASQSVSIGTVWYAIKTIWKHDGTVRIEVYGGTSDRIGFDYENLNLIGTLDYTTATSWSSGYVGVRSYRRSSYDWVRVRKYAEQEPTATVGSEETQAGVEYTISLSDEIQLSHADKKDLSLSLEEILTLIDNLRYHSILIKLLSDGILLYETTDKQADLYNAILDLISLSESKKDKISLSLSDVLTLNELLYYASAFYELLQDNISLQENFNAGFLIRQIVSDIISISEQLNLPIGINLKDSLFTLEKVIYDINTKLKEEVSLSESAEIKRVLITLLSEVIALNEIASYLYSALMEKKEVLSLSEKLINRLKLALSSTLALSEDLIKSLSVLLTDSVTLAELSKLSLIAFLITDILLNENVKRDTKVKILSLLKIDEKVVSYLGLIPHEERTLYSLIILSKLLNSDIATLRELYSLIKKEGEL